MIQVRGRSPAQIGRDGCAGGVEVALPGRHNKHSSWSRNVMSIATPQAEKRVLLSNIDWSTFEELARSDRAVRDLRTIGDTWKSCRYRCDASGSRNASP